MQRQALGVFAIAAALLLVATGSGLAASPSASPSLLSGTQLYATASSPSAVAIGDVTGDGRNDVVMTTWTKTNSDPANDFRLLVFAEQPDGTLAQPVSYATAGAYAMPPVSVAIGDITGDGRNDV